MSFFVFVRFQSQFMSQKNAEQSYISSEESARLFYIHLLLQFNLARENQRRFNGWPEERVRDEEKMR